MGKIGEIVDETTVQLTRRLKNNASQATVRSVVGSAAGIASRRVAREYVGAKLTVAGTARMLGVGVKGGFSDSAHRPRYVAETVSEEDRRLYGYGDLHDLLIRDVNQAVSNVLPQYFSQSPVLMLAARSVHIVCAKPKIEVFELDDKLTEMNEHSPLFANGWELPRSIIMGIGRVPAIAHDVTVEYLESGRPPMRSQPVPTEVAHG